jgi:hypothetical protein
MKWLVTAIVVLVLALGYLALPTVGGGEAEGAEPAAGSQGCYELVAPLSSVMEVMDELFAKMPEKVKSGQRRDFKVLRRDALFTAEVANLAGRVKERCADKDWVALSNAMKTSALAMGEAANNRDADGFNKFYEKVKESCGSCHDKYRD